MEKVSVTRVKTNVTVILKVHLCIPFTTDRSVTGRATGSQNGAGRGVSGALVVFTPKLAILFKQRHSRIAVLIFQQGQIEPWMNVDDVLPADFIHRAELIVSGGEKLVESVARIAFVPAAGNVGSQKQ